MSSDVSTLAAEIQALSPPARLRLAADLLERGKPELAHTIAEAVVLELGLVLPLRLSALGTLNTGRGGR